MIGDLAQRLQAARRQRFVGRRREIGLLEELIEAPDSWPLAMLHIYGPAGVGKTTLMTEYRRILGEADVPVVRLDGRFLEPSPTSFLAGLQLELGVAHVPEIWSAIRSLGPRWVLLITDYDRVLPLDAWVREWFCPRLPASCLTIVTSKHQPQQKWRTDPGWQQLLRSVPLRNLSTEEARAYLAQRDLADHHIEAILDFTHGHPLALSLAADTCASRPDFDFKPENVPDLVGSLLDLFMEEVDETHRAAVEAVMLVNFTTEELLAGLLDVDDAHATFQWLRGLSFIDFGPLGLYPHELARAALSADLRWRNPTLHAELHRRARSYYKQAIAGGPADARTRTLADYIFLHRNNPVVAPFFAWNETGAGWADGAQPSDRAQIVAMARKHEGDASAELAGRWFDAKPEEFVVCRDGSDQLAGFVVMHHVQPEGGALSDDPALIAARGFLDAQAGLRGAERATLFRWWMGADDYQGVGPMQSLLFIQVVGHYLTTPGLAFTLFPTAEPDFWAPVFAYADLARLPEADFTVGSRTYGVYGHDWRAVPPTAWLELLGERELQMTPTAPAPSLITPVVVLSHSDFVEAVKKALQSYAQLEQFRRTPLIQSRLVLEEAGADADDDARVGALRSILADAIDTLQATKKLAKFHRALFRTYIRPAGTQEKAAEVLGVPFSTYRRHLQRGVDHVAELLWRREIGE